MTPDIIAPATFGQWLQRHLDKKRWRPADLARAIGAANGDVSRWRRDERRPDPESVKLIAQALDADVLSAYRVLGWLDDATADTEAQADFIATIRRRNLDDDEITILKASLDALLKVRKR